MKGVDFTGLYKIMKEIVILIGFPGSGKTTYCREKLPDYIRISLYELTGMVGGNKKVAKKLELKCIEKALDMGFNVVIDRANLTERRRKKIVDFAREKHVHIKALWFSVEEHIWQERNKRRKSAEKESSPRVSELEIEDMKKEFEEPSLNEGFDELLIVNCEG
ncbi:MAG: ATP-binding protein [Candidatus Eremiobacterota bacterium]